jgi:Predicted S-adenosylmethionine-dependent methyltransferase involved in cell envelope biogenesis
MKHPTITKMSHMLMDLLVDDSMIGVDMTVGNGNDSVFLCERCKFVYGFDIQPQAIETTAKRLKSFTNFKLINDNHVNIASYIHEPIDFAIYNLGYLPNQDKAVTTMAETTLQSLKTVLEMLNENGLVCICFYPGHKEGEKEMISVLEYLGTEDYLLSTYQTKVDNSPVLYLVSRK